MERAPPVRLKTKKQLQALELLFWAGEEWWSAADMARGAQNPDPEGAFWRLFMDEDIAMKQDTAATHAAKFTELGLVEEERARARRQREMTPHFRLRLDTEGALRVVQSYLESCAALGDLHRAYRLLNSPYGLRVINGDLVRSILHLRGATVYGKVAFGHPIKFEGVPEWEVSVEAQEWPLPVRPPTMGAREIVNKIMKANEGFFLSHQRAEVDSALATHYGAEEDRTAVIPLLALISTSPNAFLQFLLPWEPYESKRNLGDRFPLARLEHVLFLLIHGALFDVAQTRRVVGICSTAQTAPLPEVAFKEGPALLELQLRDGSKVAYGAGFRAPPIAMLSPFGLVAGPRRNPVDGWARAQWRPPAAGDE